MTTVVVADNVMASDSQASSGFTILNTTTQKVFNVHGCLVGFAGRYAEGLEFVNWLERWIESNNAQYMSPNIEVNVPDTLKFDDFSALVVWPDGEVSVYEGGQHFYKAEQPQTIGSGSHFALAALDAGKTAEEAVAIAINRDVYSGGNVQSISLKEANEEFELDREKIKKMSREELIALILPEDEENKPVDEEEFDLNGNIVFETEDYYLLLDNDVLHFRSEYSDVMLSDLVLDNVREIAQDIGVPPSQYQKANKQTLIKRIRKHLAIE